jgi:hypothetical protein
VTLAASDADRPLVDGGLPAGFSVAFAAEPCADAAVRFAARRLAADERLVDVAAPEAWRRSPWPAADELFGVAAPGPDATVLVVDPLARRRDDAADALAEIGAPTVAAERLLRRDLERAGIVAFLEPGFPALLPAAAAAGRLVIVTETRPLFGWQDGLDCLVAAGTAEIVALAAAVVRRPWAFDGVRAMARLAARPYRASELYARLAFDVSRAVGDSR